MLPRRRGARKSCDGEFIRALGAGHDRRFLGFDYDN